MYCVAVKLTLQVSDVSLKPCNALPQQNVALKVMSAHYAALQIIIKSFFLLIQILF